MQTGCNVKNSGWLIFFFMLPWQGQQVNCNSWKPLGDRLELRGMCRFKKNKTKPMLHANIAAGLIQKNHWCLNYEPNSAYNLLVSRVLMNYFMREESIFRCYMFNCIHIVVRTHESEVNASLMFNQIYVKTTMKLLIIVILRQLIIVWGLEILLWDWSVQYLSLFIHLS